MVIKTERLSRSFGRVRAIRNLSFEVPEGSMFALVGTNGSGKTTTMRVLVNIIRPSEGRAIVLGVDAQALSHHDFTRIGYVSENLQLPERLTVAQYFDYLRLLYPNWDRALENSLRSQMNLPPNRMLSKLSHGMRMKTILVAGIAFRPKLLILDEPLSGMDTLTRDEVVEGLLQQAEETTILISSHEVAEIENFTSHVAFMDSGKLYFQEAIESLRSRFREVAVTLSAIKDLPESCPHSWLSPKIVGHSLQFVESEYRGREPLQRDLIDRFGVVQFEAEVMSLREISKALIRHARGNVLGW